MALGDDFRAGVRQGRALWLDASQFCMCIYIYMYTICDWLCINICICTWRERVCERERERMAVTDLYYRAFLQGYIASVDDPIRRSCA